MLAAQRLETAARKIMASDERQELIGELSVYCDLPGANTIDGSLSVADFNLSSARSRSERAKLLATRAKLKAEDMTALIEEFCQKVLQADRAGLPAVDLRMIEKPKLEDDSIRIDGLILPRSQPTIMFGDGGTAKSYTALYLAGNMARNGIPVALFDWELAGEDHRDRLERLFGAHMPRIFYARCERPLVYEVDRLPRIVRDRGILFSISIRSRLPAIGRRRLPKWPGGTSAPCARSAAVRRISRISAKAKWPIRNHSAQRSGITERVQRGL